MKITTAMHGGNYNELAKQHGLTKEMILDFSANINPLGVPASLKQTITANLDKLVEYPEPDYLALRARIASFHQLNLANVIPGNGATELIFGIAKVTKAQKVLLLAPTFAEYERAFFDAEIIYAELTKETHFAAAETVLEMIKRESDLEAVCLCNPNNPTGQLISQQEMIQIAELCEERNIYLIIDEAFMDFLEDNETISMINYLESFPHLAIIRAFTKFFAIPGLRLGYLLTKNDLLAEALLQMREPWSINTFADMAGQVLLDDTEYITQTYNWISAERDFLYQELSKFSELTVYRPSVNYIFFHLETSLDLRKELLLKGIFIRSCANYRGLTENYYRVAVKARCDNTKLIRALEVIFSGN
ncbi:threonine-phosphate decarboxylase [Listeria innocua]|uniref:threonine-phosphate decarboxylase CobD n=1 Tax=Listeria innocua TaxID=1642 RepID=UPI0010D1D2F9|nr:threonine-phosphate decarboxylase CobD [Listeria innocua]EDO1157317.1 threonine-phosphate decarboxylase [Listeria innocua]EED2111193.1 threonine-phosphate decarboxylase [Listeria innocua]EEU7570977.1 threonine-phosphate decarboxylase [Listeria innocua]EHY9115840.1 threonine-phosphate decarboxylase [Listeria innocua]EHY9118715.1 threonine-phosphate decarboxylase [Listeria innocua]